MAASRHRVSCRGDRNILEIVDGHPRGSRGLLSCALRGRSLRHRIHLSPASRPCLTRPTSLWAACAPPLGPTTPPWAPALELSRSLKTPRQGPPLGQDWAGQGPSRAFNPCGLRWIEGHIQGPHSTRGWACPRHPAWSPGLCSSGLSRWTSRWPPWTRHVLPRAPADPCVTLSPHRNSPP